jgi:hypothetical protein
MFEVCSAKMEIPSDSVLLQDLKYQICGQVKVEIVPFVSEMRSQSSFLLVVY